MLKLDSGRLSFSSSSSSSPSPPPLRPPLGLMAQGRVALGGGGSHRRPPEALPGQQPACAGLRGAGSREPVTGAACQRAGLRHVRLHVALELARLRARVVAQLALCRAFARVAAPRCTMRLLWNLKVLPQNSHDLLFGRRLRWRRATGGMGAAAACSGTGLGLGWKGFRSRCIGLPRPGDTGGGVELGCPPARGSRREKSMAGEPMAMGPRRMTLL